VYPFTSSIQKNYISLLVLSSTIRVHSIFAEPHGQAKQGIRKVIILLLLLDFPNRVRSTRFRPQRPGHFAPLSFTAYGGKIQATRYAGGR
jgi:hypothetical protein